MVIPTGPTWYCKKTKSCIRNNGYTMVMVRVRFGYTRFGALATPISLLFAVEYVEVPIFATFVAHNLRRLHVTVNRSSEHRSSFTELCKPHAFDCLIVTATPQECTLNLFIPHIGPDDVTMYTACYRFIHVVIYAATGSSSVSVVAFRKAS